MEVPILKEWDGKDSRYSQLSAKNNLFGSSGVFRKTLFSVGIFKKDLVNLLKVRITGNHKSIREINIPHLVYSGGFMKKVELKRIEQTLEATIGVLLVDGEAICWTLEEPWRDNLPDVSCIPTGEYILQLEYSPSKRCELWTIKEVPGRSYVRIHKGNTVDDTQGCPLTGAVPGRIDGRRAVLNSRKAFAEFMSVMEDDREAQIVVSMNL